MPERPVSAEAPPVAERRPVRLEKHGHVRTDDYYWLRERDDPAVCAYLAAENDHTRRAMAHLEGLERTLFDEIVGRLKQNDETVPYRLDDHFYYARYAAGQEYPIYCRKHGTLEAPEQVMLDCNELARGHDFFDLGALQVSSGQNVLAYATDTVGRRIYTVRFRDLATGATLPDELVLASGSFAWALDNRTLFYARLDPVTLRPFQVWRHELGTAPAADALVLEEPDETFRLGVWRTKSKRFVIAGAFQSITTEYRFLEAADPRGAFRTFLPRERGHEYSVDHYGDSFFVRTNDGAKNFRLIETPVERTGREHWRERIPHREDVLLEDVEIFRDHLVVVERREGLIRLRVRPWSGAAEHEIDFGEPAYLAWVSVNPQFDTTVLRYGYSSMTTPDSIYDYDMATRSATLRKRDEVVGDFDPVRYRTVRLDAPARDGERVPISLVHRRDTPLDGTSPLLLYGYGAYGLSLDARFNASRLSLLDRGFVFAMAHIRGGEELGRRWYEDGKLRKKWNTFHDFIDCAEHLVRERYADPRRLYAYGGSAGGLLVGAVINERPELFHGAVAVVPFVDLVTTMLDESLPLTTGEYDEWGDPNDEASYRYMLSYSPYDNVVARPYPHLLVTTGLHDSQVQYFEPAKWVARMRAAGGGTGRLLLKTNMDAGHGGASGRFRRHRETATEYAFLLDLAGLGGSGPQGEIG